MATVTGTNSGMVLGVSPSTVSAQNEDAKMAVMAEQIEIIAARLKNQDEQIQNLTEERDYALARATKAEALNGKIMDRLEVLVKSMGIPSDAMHSLNHEVRALNEEVGRFKQSVS